MKFVDGLPLGVYRRKYIEKHGPIPFDDIVQILWAVAKGLDYAHDRNVIHRDIKPQNIMISRTDGVQVIDFGLAEEIRSMRHDENVSKISGTRSYMAPEQWEGTTQDARTDQYALAVTAYELLSGRVPFYSKDSETLRNQVLHDPVEPISGLSESVNAALLRALSKKREDRFENCKAFVRALAVKSDTDSNDGPCVILPVDRLADDVSQPTWLPSASLSSSSETAKRKRIVPVMIFTSILLFTVLAGFLWWSKSFDETETFLEHSPELPIATKYLSLGLSDYSGSGFTNEMLDKLKHPEEFPVIRMTLFMDEDYNGVLRVERCMSDTPPDNYFKGEPFSHSAFPNALAFRGENGMGRMIWGLNDSLESSWNRYHSACGRVTNTDRIADGTFHTFGGEIAIFNNRPPVRICCDFPETQDGAATIFIGGGGGNQGGYARTWFYTRYTSTNSYTIGYNSSNVDMEYDNTLGSLPAHNIKLDQPFERKIKFKTKFGGPDLGAAVHNSNGAKRITRFDLSGRVICWTGMDLTTKDNRLAIDKVTEKCAAWRVGLQEGDIIERINGKEYAEADAKKLLKGTSFGTEYVLDIDRNGERQTYTVHAE